MCEWLFVGVFSTGRTTSAEARWCFSAGRYERRRGRGGSPPGALSAPKGEWTYTEATPSGAAPTSPPEGVFRPKRRMELDELSGSNTTGRLGCTCRLEPTPSEGLQGWHSDTLSSPQPPPTALVLRDDCGPPGVWGMGTAAASAGAAGPSEGLRAGWSSGRTDAGVHLASGPHTFGSGPTTGTRSQTTCYVRRGTGRVDGNGQI